MNSTIRLLIVLAMACLVGPALAQQPPQPGPELDHLKHLEGTWDATVKSMGGESKGTMVYKMDVGGLWLVGDFEGNFGPQKFVGKSLDSYDANKKKYVSVWVDSMSTSPMLSEGTLDKEKKAMIMTGEGPGMDGKTTKYKMVTELKDDDNMVFTLSSAQEGNEQAMMTITYKRRK
jgi:hypothetical protein